MSATGGPGGPGAMRGQAAQTAQTAPTAQAAQGSEASGDGLLASRLFWAGYGVLLAVMGARLPMWSWPPQGGQVIALALSVAVFPALAQPYVGRPVLASMRFHDLVLVHRNTVLPGAFVLLVASEKPPVWAAGVDALLLAGYLLLTDALTVPPHIRRRIASPAFLVLLVAVVAGATALLSLQAQSGSYRPVLVAAAAAAALGAALATGFGRAEERRVGSPGEPKAETGPKKARDRSAE